jgi:hypothetical protein
MGDLCKEVIRIKSNTNYMNLSFTLQEMKEALISAGYELKEMEVEIESPFKGTPSRFIPTTNVFKDGKEVCSWGYQRVEYSFQELLKEKLLDLFRVVPGIRKREEATKLFKEQATPPDTGNGTIPGSYYEYKPR